LRQRHPAPFLRDQGFNNVYVQVTKIVDAEHQANRRHNAVNSDPSALGLDNTLGLGCTLGRYVPDAPKSGIFDKYVAVHEQQRRLEGLGLQPA